MVDNLDPSTDPFSPFLGGTTGPTPEPVSPVVSAEAPEGPDPFATFLPQKQITTDPASSFMHSAERGAIPAAVGLAAVIPGMETGAAIGGAAGSFFGGVGAIPGAIVGGIAGGFLGPMFASSVTASAQDYAIDQLPEGWQDLLGQSQQQRAAEAEQQGTATFLGGIAPYLLTMKPGMDMSTKALPANATTFQKIMANPVTSHIFGGAVMGGMEIGTEAGQGEPINWTHAAIATGFGMVFNKPNRLGERLMEVGGRPWRSTGMAEPANANEPVGVSEPPPAEIPTVAQAGDAKVMGPGVDEGVFMGSHAQAPDAAMTAQETARTEAAIFKPPQPDVRAVAQRMEPELFSQYDELAAQRDDLQARIAQLGAPGDETISELSARRDALDDALDQHLTANAGYEGGAEARRLRAQIRDAQAQLDEVVARRDAEEPATPELAALQQHLQATDLAMRDLAPQIGAAHRRAADASLSEVIEPEAAPLPPPVEAPLAADASRETSAEPSAQPVEQQAAFIAQDMARQLIAAGRPAAEAEAVGQLQSRHYIARSARLNGTMTPLELYRTTGPTIRAGKAPPAPLMPTVDAPNLGRVRSEPVAPPEPVAGPVAEPVAAGPRPSELESLDPMTIGVDARRFQFKEGGDESGVTERLQDVGQWDPRLAGTTLVWRDENGKDWIADGHQRLGLARRLTESGQPGIRLNAFVLDAASGITDVEARAIAAVKNIAEGTGTSVDAAKALRAAKELGLDLPPLPPRSTLARDGKAIAELSPEAFGMVVNEVIPPGQAAMIARLVKDPAAQSEAIRLLSKVQPENARQAEMVIRDMLASGTEMMKQDSLFGEEAFASSIVLERAKVAEEAIKQLRKDRSTFRTLVDEAERIEGQGENVLDQAANASRLTTDEKAADLLTQLAFRAGPVSDELSGIARRLKSGELTGAAAAREFLGTIRRAVEEGVDTGADTGRPVAGADGERQGVEPPDPNQSEFFQPAPPIDTPEFNRWFGDSKVVDDSGAPLVMYHSTSGPDFDRFRRRTGDIGMHFGTVGQAEDRANYLATVRNSGEVPEGQRMIPVYLSIKRPLRFNDAGLWNPDNMAWKLVDMFPADKQRIYGLNSTKKLREYLQSKGYDGIVYKNTGESNDAAKMGQLRTVERAARDAALASQKARKKSLNSFDKEDQATPEYQAWKVAEEAERAFREGEGAADSWIAFEPSQIKSKFNRGTFDPADPRILYQGGKPAPWRQGDMLGEFETERGQEGFGQALIPGVKPLTDAERIAAEAAKPLKGGTAAPGGLFDETKTNQGTLFQTKRGSITFAEGKRPIIKLFADADASTFIHETGHQWLEELIGDASHPAAGDSIKGDAEIVRKWLGMKGDKIATAQHEKFARGFEQYMREGVAPSPALARVFAQFKTWLTSIYQTIKGLGSPINEDIRGVFDRLIELDPQRTVVAAEREAEPSLHDIHETDAAQAEPHHAEPIGDRISAERDAYIAQQSPEVQNELASATAEQQAADAAQLAGEGGAQPAGGTGLGAPGSEPGSQSAGGAGGSELSPELGSGGAGVPESDGAGRTIGGGPAADTGAGLRPERSGPARAAGSHPLAPNPTDVFGPAESPFTDKAGNIRIENLTTDQDVAQAIRDSAQENNDFIGDRRGVITDGQVLDLADALGMDTEQLNRRRLGQAFNAEQVMAARKLLIESATDVSTLMKKVASGGTDEDVLAFARAKARHQMIQGQVAGITAEAGRALRAFRSLAGETDVTHVDQFIKQATGKTLFQLREEAALGSLLDTPEQVSKFMQDTKRRSFSGMVLEYWINGLVSGPRTHVTNTVSNAIMSMQVMGPETAAAAVIGKLASVAGRKGTRIRMGEVGAHVRGGARGLAPATKAAIDALRTGRSITLPGEKPRAAPYESASAAAISAGLDEAAKFSDIAPDVFGMIRGVLDGAVAVGKLVSTGGQKGAPLVGLKYSPLGQIPDIAVRGTTVLPIGTAFRLPTRFLAAGDSFFRALNYSMEKSAIAYRSAADEGLAGVAFDQHVAKIYQNPTPEVMEQAGARATELTFMSRRSAFVNALNRLAETKIAGLPILKFVVPFINTPANIIEQTALHRTPIGLFSPEIRADLSGKNGNIAQDTAAARMLVGSAYAIGFGALTAQGLMSGSGPSDSNERAIWRMAGNQPHSVRIGDMWYDIRITGPLGMLAGIASDMYDVAHSASEGDMAAMGSGLQQAFMQNILDASFMKGPSDLIQALEDPGRYGQSYIRTYLSSFVPFSGAMGQIARGTDPYSRQARTIADTVKAKVPGLAQTLPVRRDIWGMPLPSGTAFGPATLSAVYTSKISTDPVNIALSETNYWPGTLSRKIRGVELTDEQYDEFQVVAGGMAKQRLDLIVRSQQWQTWPAQVRHDVISETVRQSRETARNVLMGKYPDIAAEATRAKLAGLQ